jgi:hypothetical protein
MPPGWYGDAKYGRVVPGAIDGIGCMHFTVHNDCDRCGEDYIMARFHHHRVLEALEKHKGSLAEYRND